MKCVTRIGLLLVLLVVATPSTVHAQPGSNSVYDDPDGRFSVPVPTNWRAESRSGYVALTDPEGGISVYALALVAESAEQGITAAWALVDPSFSLTVEDITRPPSEPGVEETVDIGYDSGRERFVAANGRLVQGVVYVLLADGPVAAVARRASQLQIIISGFRITAVERVTLTGVAPKPVTAELIARLEAYITETMPRHDVPGAAVAIVQDGRVVYTRGFGVRERHRPEPVTPDTMMMIGSTGKTMTTMMMATLVDEGRLRWDQPVVEILPAFALSDPETTRRVTVQNLVCACTGVPRRDLELLFNANTLTARDIVESLAGFQVFTDFGEAFQYSNQMVGTGGYIAALAGGATYADLYNGYLAQMQARVFDAIGMPNTTFSFEQVRAAPDHATPHGLTLGGDYIPLPLSDEELLRPIAPAGASWSNARDMARYLITELNRGVSQEGRRVVSEQNLGVTWTPQVPVSAETSYGLGWFVDSYKGLRLLHHGGNTLGFTSDLAFLPDAGTGIVVLSNAQGSNVFNEAVRVRLFELLYDQPMEHDAQAVFAQESIRQSLQDAAAGLQDGIDSDAVAPYLGTFTNAELGMITLRLSKGRLTVDAGEFVSELRVFVSRMGRTSYVIFDPPITGLPFDLTTDADGNPIIVLETPTDTYTFRRS